MAGEDLGQLLSDVQDSLDDICYKDVTNLDKAVQEGLKSSEFSNLVCYLCKEVASLSDLEDSVNDDSEVGGEAWMMELSSLLRELGCPHRILTEGPVMQRLDSKKSKLILLDFLLSELMAARMIAVNKPKQNLDIHMTESPTAAALKKMLLALGFPKPPDNITPLQLWEKVAAKVQEVVGKAPPTLLGTPLLTKQTLSADQWKLIEQIAEGDHAELAKREVFWQNQLRCFVQNGGGGHCYRKEK